MKNSLSFGNKRCVRLIDSHDYGKFSNQRKKNNLEASREVEVSNNFNFQSYRHREHL